MLCEQSNAAAAQKKATDAALAQEMVRVYIYAFKFDIFVILSIKMV